MSSTPQITTSRRGIIASALGVCTLIALPKKSHALARTESNQIMKIDLSSPEAYIKAVDEAGVGWSRYTLGPNGECCLADSYLTYELAEKGCTALATSRVGASKIMTIAVKVGKAVIGYIKALVRPMGQQLVRWIIEEILSPGTHYLVQQAAKDLIGKPYVSTYAFPCSVYPPHSGEYHRCMSA